MKKISGILAVTFALGVGMTFGQATPEDALKEFKGAVEAGDLAKIASLVPASYVKDATGLVQDFAGKMDPEIWNKLRETVGGASKVIAAKAPLFTDFMGDAEKPLDAAAKAAQAKTLTEVMSGLEKLAKSDLISLDALKKVESAAFLKEIDKTFAAAREAAKALPKSEALQELDKPVKKSEKLENGDVKLFFGDDDEDAAEVLRQVEGRWVSAEIAEEWTKNVKETREKIAAIDFTTPEGKTQKAQFMMVLGMLDPMIQQIGEVENAEQLQEKIGGLLFPLMMMGGGMPGMMPGTTP